MKKHIPNLFTFGNLFCGFLAIPYIVNGDVKNATLLIFIALMLDAIDGRAARILNVSGDLGKQLDSLADVVSFGVAPALLASYTYFSDMGMTGIVLAALFPLCGAYRLARFNITATEESLNHFKGVPITFAGGLVSFIILFERYIPFWLFVILFFGLAILMVSKIKIPSFKKVTVPKNGVLITLFLFYMFYLFAKNSFDKVPGFFYLSLIIYILFITIRYIRVKRPISIEKKKYKIIIKRNKQK